MLKIHIQAFSANFKTVCFQNKNYFSLLDICLKKNLLLSVRFFMTAGVKVCGDQLMDYYREKSILSKIPKIISIFSEICIRINVDPQPSDILSNSYWAVILSDCYYQPCTLSKLWENEGRQYKKRNMMEHLINQTLLTFILPVKMEISKEGSTLLACLSCFFSGKGIPYFQLFLFCLRPKETFLKIQSLQCRPSNHDLT